MGNVLVLEDPGTHLDGEGAGEEGGHGAGYDLQRSLADHQTAPHPLLVDQV